MIELFHQKWKFRDDWFRWCEDVPQVELTAVRSGGTGSILRGLFDIVDTEQYWIRALAYGTEHHYSYEEHHDLDTLRTLSKRLRPLVEETVLAWSSEIDASVRYVDMDDGDRCGFAYGDVLRRLIAHEWHTQGQLSVWACELGIQPAGSGILYRKPGKR
jgi:uncharacterized damage-inducible protein DinB